MTEVCDLDGSLGSGIYNALGWARNLHRHVMSGTQAWIWWWLTNPGSPQTLITVFLLIKCMHGNKEKA